MPTPGGRYSPKPSGTPIVSRQQQYATMRERQRQTLPRPEHVPDLILVKMAEDVKPAMQEKFTEKQLEGLKNCRRIRTCPHCHKVRFDRQCQCRGAVNARSSFWNFGSKK